MFFSAIANALKLALIGLVLALLVAWLRKEFIRDRFLGIGLSILAIMLLLYFAFFEIIYNVWVD